MRWTAFALWWLGIMLILFGIIETWRGFGIGEMSNYILAGIGLRWYAKDFFE